MNLLKQVNNMNKLQFAQTVEEIYDECKTENEVYSRYDKMVEILFEYSKLRIAKLKTLGIIYDE